MIVAAVIIGCATDESVKNITNICTGYGLSDNVQDVTNCSQYFVCTQVGATDDIVPILENCGDQYFNPITSACDAPQNVECFSCPSEPYYIDLPVDYNCIQFVRCFAGVPEQRTCAAGLLFDPAHASCNFEKDVDCACPTHDNPLRPYFVRDRFDCNA